MRKQNLTRLFEKMQAYQYEQISADPDKPLADGIRALDTTDMERYSVTNCVVKLKLSQGSIFSYFQRSQCTSEGGNEGSFLIIFSVI